MGYESSCEKGAEISGIAYDACLLGSLNLAEYVTDNKEFDYNSFKKDVATAIKALNVVKMETMDTLPLPEQRDSANRTHQIGLGLMGIATMLINRNIKYGSYESIIELDKIMHVMFNEAVRESANYAKEHGTFAGYDYELTSKSPMFELLDDDVKELVKQNGLFNLKLLSVAPTGTISTLYNVSSGIEPYFALSYTRTTETLGDKKEVHKVYIPIVEAFKNNNPNAELPEWFVDSSSIDYDDRVAVQAIVQKYVDNSISSTVNLPKGTKAEIIKDLYIKAWKSGLKGITVYVDGSLDTQILNYESPHNITPNEIKDINYKERIIDIGCGKIRMLIGYNTKTLEIHDYFTIRTGQGGCSSNINSFAIVTSKYIKKGGNLKDLLDSLEGSEGCNSFSMKRARGAKLSKGKNCATAMINALLDFRKELESGKVIIDTVKTETKPIIVPVETKEEPTVQCQVCGEQMVSDGHCYVCKSCGNTYCD